jgi:hypothetical protein
VAEWLEQAGRGAEPEDVWRAAEAGWRAAEAGDPVAMERLINLLKLTGRGAEAARLGRFGIEPAGRTADPWEMPPLKPDAVQPG